MFFLFISYFNPKRYAMNETIPSILKPYNIKELAELYVMSKKTMRTWLKPHAEAIGPRHGRYYTIRQVAIIFEKLGMPQVRIEIDEPLS